MLGSDHTFEEQALAELRAIRNEIQTLHERLDRAEAASKAVLADLKTKLGNTALGRILLGSER